jgi:N-methylhydantoinase B
MIDPIALSVFQNATHSIAEEMGATLRRTAISPNIKERRDYSCAIFDARARVIAMGDHMPVHLGSMPLSVEAAVRALNLRRGDVAILNDPYAGGTHLPDITLVMPIFAADREDLIFYAAARAHHADVGGMFAGSMGPAREIYQEGIRIPPMRLVRAGKMDEEVLSLILANVRTPLERSGDLAAQIGACRVGAERLQELAQKYGDQTAMFCDELLNYSERLMRSELQKMPAGEFSGEDFIDNATTSDASAADPVRIRATLRFSPTDASAEIDFAGSSPQVLGSINAVFSITYSACFYVMRCLLPADAPATAGLMRPVRVTAPAASIVNAIPPAAVAAGNVETSQRIVDVLLRALAQAAPAIVPAASYGTMSNLTIGGTDTRRSPVPFAYYETTAGGMGARPASDGPSGMHAHMTNSLNTPIEALEYAYPLRLRRYSYREHSGGAGHFRGGDGIIREIELLDDAQVTLLCDRHRTRPYGLAGGESGTTGRATLTHSNGEHVSLPAKSTTFASRGDRIRIETPGGGGWGKPD